MTTASICTIGDEILIGQITDTNSAVIARALSAIGVQVSSILSIADDRDEIVRRLGEELAENDLVITTGGLGPTKDDLTKEALSRLTGGKSFYLHEGQYNRMKTLLHSRGLDTLAANQAQALVPDTCEVIENRLGTAPVMVFRLREALYRHCPTLYALPGVPFEAAAALDEVLADIRAHCPLGHLLRRNLMTYGLAESAIAKKIAPWEAALPENMRLAYLPDPLTGVKLRLSMKTEDEAEGNLRMEAEISRLEALLGDCVYSAQEDRLEAVIGRILRENGRTLSAAESCTGGEISHLLTTVPGSSAYYLGSVTSYAVPVKEKVLGVPAETIARYGVVSSEVAAAMAEGVRRLTGSDYAVATTGLAGPGGGDGVNPEGTVWVGAASAARSSTARFEYHDDRRRNIQRFAASALHFLLRFIRNELGLHDSLPITQD